MRDIVKRFPGVLALDHVSLSVEAGEVHALLGENGAGKSTLMKILSGAYQRDEGEILIDGKSVEIKGSHDAQALGISIIYQELNLTEQLSVAENIFLGRPIMKNPLMVDWREMTRQAQRILDELGVDISAKALVRDLGVAHKQMVEVAKALSINSRILVMDEPTAPLTNREIDTLFATIRMLKAEGVSIIYISHRLEEVMEVCDRATIMRDGRNVTHMNVKDTNLDEIIRYMVGRYTYAIGGNENCAKLSGINLGRTKCLVYTISGLCCGVAALLLTSRLDSAVPTNADGQEMDAIAAVVIGGTSMKGGEGSMIGTLIGIMIIGVISNGLNLLGVAQGPQRMVKGLIIVVAVIIDVVRRKAAEAAK